MHHSGGYDPDTDTLRLQMAFVVMMGASSIDRKNLMTCRRKRKLLQLVIAVLLLGVFDGTTAQRVFRHGDRTYDEACGGNCRDCEA